MISHWIIRGIGNDNNDLYWSKTHGWVNFYGATVFTTKEKDDNSDLPLAGKWKHVDAEADKREAAYVKNKGCGCLYCSSENIQAGHFESDGDNVWCEVECHDCQQVWQDDYKLVGITKV